MFSVEVLVGTPVPQGLLSSRGPLSALLFLLRCVVQCFLLFGGHVGLELHYPVAAAVSIVMPGNDLYRVVIESNVRPSIEGRRVGITIIGAGGNQVPNVTKNCWRRPLVCPGHPASLAPK